MVGATRSKSDEGRGDVYSDRAAELVMRFAFVMSFEVQRYNYQIKLNAKSDRVIES